MTAMVDEMKSKQQDLTRRAFVARCSALAVAGTALFSDFMIEAGAAETTETHGANGPGPIVAFHMDRPYLDMMGRAMPYIPPTGTRSGQALAERSQEELLRRFGYL